MVPAVAIAGGCTFAARKIFPNKLVVSPVGLGMIITGAALYSLGSSMRLCYDRVNPTVQSIFEKVLLCIFILFAYFHRLLCYFEFYKGQYSLSY